MLAREKSQAFYCLSLTGSLCALPPDNGPCLSVLQDVLSPAKITSVTPACANYLSDLQNSCSMKNTSSNFEECTSICGKLFVIFILKGLYHGLLASL